MSKTTKPLFEKGDKIKLERKKIVRKYGSGQTVLILPSFTLTYIGTSNFTRKALNDHLFKVSFDENEGSKETARNNDDIVISVISFEGGLAFKTIK